MKRGDKMNILNTVVKTRLESTPVNIAILLIGIIVFALGVMFIGEWLTYNDNNFAIVGVAMSVIGFLLLFSLPTEEYERHEATIDDFNEVYEQGYEIVDQRGDIYILENVKEY